jgi:hypothetical protein
MALRGSGGNLIESREKLWLKREKEKGKKVVLSSFFLFTFSFCSARDDGRGCR